MLLTTQKKSDQQLSAEEFRATGRHHKRPDEQVEDYEPILATWRANPACWLILSSGEISAPNGGQVLPDNVTTKESARKLIPAPPDFIGAPSDPNENRATEAKFVRYLYHTDKSSRKIRVAVRENGVPIKIRETEREILRRRAEMDRVVPFFDRAKEERQKKRRGEAHSPALAGLCERLSPTPRITREVRESDKIAQPDKADLPQQAQRLLRLLQKKLGIENGFLVFDCLRRGCSVRQSAAGLCAESSLRLWIESVK